jgi:hypothetical protein
MMKSRWDSDWPARLLLTGLAAGVIFSRQNFCEAQIPRCETKRHARPARKTGSDSNKMKMPSLDLVKRRVAVAIDLLLLNDAHLILEGVGERSITHKLAEYLQQLFRSWHIDCEYNKLGAGVKMLPLQDQAGWIEDSPVYPDIIVHRRGMPKDRDNPPHCLVIEARKHPATAKKIRRDREKIDRYLDTELRYRYGLLIEFRVKSGLITYSPEWKESQTNRPL